MQQRADFELVRFSTDAGRGFFVRRTKDKQRLAHWSLPISQGLYAFDVAGTSYRRKALQEPGFSPGKRLAVVPEPNNPVDPEALAVWDSACNLHVGYVPRDCAPTIKRRIIDGERFKYVSMWENRKGRLRVGLRVLVIAADVKVRLART